MKKLFLISIAFVGLFAFLANTATAHGGQYRGPEDIVPPGGSGKGKSKLKPPGTLGKPKTGTPPAPDSGSGRNPRQPGVTGKPPTPGSNPNNPITGRRGIPVGPDLSKWQYWWEFNKDLYINLKDALYAPVARTGTPAVWLGPTWRDEGVDSARPSPTDIHKVILPALLRAQASTDNPDINSSCLIGIAKVGQSGDGNDVLAALKKGLTSHNQEIRETAAVAMGISALAEVTDSLLGLATDSAQGRKLVGNQPVDDRTRSFAIYGLGLISYANESKEVKSKVLDALKLILEQDKNNNRNILVAAINAMGLLSWHAEQDKDLLKDSLQALDRFYDLDFGRGRKLIQSHVPPAIAKLLGRRNSDLHKHYKEKFAQEVSSKKKLHNDIRRGAVIALGQLALANETGKEADSKYSKQLLQFYKTGKDKQAKYFALMALGQIGGNVNRSELLKALATGQKVMEQPWAAMALGVLSFHKMENDANAMVDDTIGHAIHREFLRNQNPEARAAFSVALGLCKYREAAHDLMEMLDKKSRQDELAGYLCIGLALMDYKKAKTQIHNLVLSSVRRPNRLKQAAIALGKLGDKTVTNTLIQMLQERETNLAKLSSISAALGFIGDRRTIGPLKNMLFNEELTQLSRAFAAVALGGVADKENLPWNSKISRNMNYRGAVETLTQSGTGVLDIL